MEELAVLLTPLIPPPVNDRRKQLLKSIIQTQIIKHTLFAIPELQLQYPEVICDEHGNVTIRGNVPSSAAARRAADIVSGIPDVSTVNNELNVVLNDIPNRLPPFMN